jgi:hypothetical protein
MGPLKNYLKDKPKGNEGKNSLNNSSHKIETSEQKLLSITS